MNGYATRASHFGQAMQVLDLHPHGGHRAPKHPTRIVIGCAWGVKGLSSLEPLSGLLPSNIHTWSTNPITTSMTGSRCFFASSMAATSIALASTNFPCPWHIPQVSLEGKVINTGTSTKAACQVNHGLFSPHTLRCALSDAEPLVRAQG